MKRATSFEKIEDRLVLYCRQLAWLGATPDKQKISRMEAIRTKEAFVLEKIDSNLAEDSSGVPTVPLEIELPALPESFSHLRELFFIMGQVLQTGMGIVPVTWAELKAFIEVKELDLTLWERGMLKKMSDAYCNEYAQASSPSRPAPYKVVKEAEEVDGIAVGMQIAAALAAFRKKK